MIAQIFTKIALVTTISTVAFTSAQAYEISYKNGVYTGKCENGYSWIHGDGRGEKSSISHETAVAICAKQGSYLSTNPKGKDTSKATQKRQLTK